MSVDDLPAGDADDGDVFDDRVRDLEREALIRELVDHPYTINDRGVWSCLNDKALAANVARIRYLAREQELVGSDGEVADE